jgi:hypothetical protein
LSFINQNAQTSDTPYKTNNNRRRYQTGEFSTNKSQAYTAKSTGTGASMEIYQECPIIHQEITCGDIIGGQYLLLGSDKCLMVVDLALPIEHQQVVILISGVRFKKVQVLEDYNVVIALCGKNNHVRSYKLSSLKKLIRYALGQFMPSRDWRRNTNTTSSFYGTQGTDMGMDSVYRAARGGMDQVDDKALADKWANDYHKVLETKQSIDFQIQRTEETIFLASYTQKDIVLFQWAKEPYLKFLKWKQFYLPPETPRFLKLLHDGVFVKEIFVCYAREANVINVDQGQVAEFSLEDGAEIQWQSLDQLPIKDVPKLKERVTVNRKLLAVVRSTTSRQSDKMTATERHFLATSGQQSYVVDLQGRRVAGCPQYKWSRPPDRVIIVDSARQLCGISAQFVEVLSLDTGERVSGDELSFPTLFLSQCSRTMDVFLVSHKSKKFSYILSLPLVDAAIANGTLVSDGGAVVKNQSTRDRTVHSRDRDYDSRDHERDRDRDLNRDGTREREGTRDREKDRDKDRDRLNSKSRPPPQSSRSHPAPIDPSSSHHSSSHHRAQSGSSAPRSPIRSRQKQHSESAYDEDPYEEYTPTPPPKNRRPSHDDHRTKVDQRIGGSIRELPKPSSRPIKR